MLGPIPAELGLHKQVTVFGRCVQGVDGLIDAINEFGIDEKTGQCKYPITIVDCGEFKYADRYEQNGYTIGWNNYVKESAGMEGITSPEREFDKAWSKLLIDEGIMFRDDLKDEHLSKLPPLDPNSTHKFVVDRDGFLADQLKWKADVDVDAEPDCY